MPLTVFALDYALRYPVSGVGEWVAWAPMLLPPAVPTSAERSTTNQSTPPQTRAHAVQEYSVTGVASKELESVTASMDLPGGEDEPHD